MGKVGQPDGSMVIPFGKHKNEAIADVPSAYLRWMVDNLDDDKAELIEAAEFELDFRDKWQTHK